MNQIWLNTPKSQMIDSVVRMTSSGRRYGSGHVRNVCHGPALQPGALRVPLVFAALWLLALLQLLVARAGCSRRWSASPRS